MPAASRRRSPGSRRGRRPGFTVVADEFQPEQDKRWALLAPPGARGNAATLLLPSAAFPSPLRIAGTLGGSGRAATPEQAAFIGNQAGGRVFLLLKQSA